MDRWGGREIDRSISKRYCSLSHIFAPSCFVVVAAWLIGLLMHQGRWKTKDHFNKLFVLWGCSGDGGFGCCCCCCFYAIGSSEEECTGHVLHHCVDSDGGGSSMVVVVVVVMVVALFGW